jgi:hypothetical protein
MWFLPLVVQVGPGAPHASMAWDSGCQDMELRVKRVKLMMILHLRDLEDETLARTIYKEHISLNHPGLAQEAKGICRDLKIEDSSTTRLSKKYYIILVSAACHSKDEERLRGKATGKCIRILNENYCNKEYYY